ncbi:MAG: MFS transporter [Lentisphaerota bacterium]
MSSEQKRKMTFWSMVAYGSGDIFGGGTPTTVAALYTLFLTTVAGVHPLTVGMIFLIVKIMSAVVNPVIGYITDHTRSRWGRRRIYFLFGCIPFFALPWIMLNFDSQLAKTLWYGGTFIIYNICWSIVSVPYYSILADMTSDYTERSKATGMRMFFSKLGTLIGTWVPLTIVGMFTVKSQGYMVMGIVVGLIYAVPWFICFLFTWEREDIVIEKTHGVFTEMINLYKNFLSTLRNSSFRKHLLMYLGALTTFDIFMAVFILSVTITMGKTLNFARDVLATVQVCQFIGLPLITWLCCKYSNSTGYVITAVFLALSIVAFGMMPNDATYLQMSIVGLFTGMGIAGTVMSAWNNLPFIADVDEIITTKRREGIYAGFQAFTRQVCQGLGMLMINLTLSYIGFVAGTGEQSEATREGIRHFMMIAPPIILLIGILGAIFFKINKQNHAILMGEIHRLKDGGSKTNVQPKVKKVVESLTGIKYDNLWKADLVK